MARITIPACTATARVLRNAVVLYSEDFTGGLGGWVGLGSGALAYGWASRSPGGFQSAGSAITQSATKSVSGLTIGRTYTLLAHAGASVGTGTTAKVGVSGVGSGTATAITYRTLVQVSYQFVATATTHTLQLTTTSTGAFLSVWDAVRLIEHESQIGSDIALQLRPGSRVAVDERRAPFAQASLRIALPSDSDLELLDTRSSTSRVRVEIEAVQQMIDPAGADETRTFDLLLHERDGDYSTSGAEITLVCHSDEAITIDAGNATSTVDATPSLDSPSLRAIISIMLQKRGMFLQAGAADADYTITTEVINLLTNPSAETNATNWFASTGCSAVARSTTVGGKEGTAAIRATASASTMQFRPNAATVTLDFDEQFSFTIWLRGQVARSAHLELVFRNAGATVLSTDVGDTIVTSTSAWTEYTVSGTAPSGAVEVLAYVVVTGNSVGQFTYSDLGTLTKTAFPVPAFDGDTATDTYYSYAWNDVAHASTSSRIRLDDRDPLLLFQDPGETDWDFLQPLVQAAGLRLFCDEQRRWYLVDPSTYVVAGTLALEDASRGRDRISRDRGDWADAVVVEYNWIGNDGTPQKRYDAAGTGTMLQTVKWNRPYPGPGAAAAILARYQGRGRVQEIIAPPQLAATPAMALTTDLPSTPAQEGFASRVTFRLDSDGIGMSIDARDLEDA